MFELTDNEKNTPVVKESNLLIRASYHLTANEKNLMSLAARKLLLGDYIRDPDFGNVACITIKTAEYAKAFNVSTQNAATNIRKSLKSIITKEVVFPDPDNDTIDLKAETGIGWISARRDKPKRGEFIVALNPVMEAYVCAKTNFALLDVLEQGALSNGHVMRLYNSLRDHHWKNDDKLGGTLTMSIEWMQERYKLPASYAKRLPDFRRRFLHPAVMEISQKTVFNMLDKEGNLTIKEFIPKGQNKPTAIAFNYKYQKKV